jgi:hypothetical protein
LSIEVKVKNSYKLQAMSYELMDVGNGWGNEARIGKWLW